MLLSLLCGLALIVGIGVACLNDPTEVRWFPRCLFHELTGFDCPGCGTARAIHAAARGDFAAALRFNAVLAIALPFLIGIIIRPEWAKKPRVAWSVFGVAVGWMIIRNVVSRCA